VRSTDEGLSFRAVAKRLRVPTMILHNALRRTEEGSPKKPTPNCAKEGTEPVRTGKARDYGTATRTAGASTDGSARPLFVFPHGPER
jgi:hypothetical protein